MHALTTYLATVINAHYTQLHIDINGLYSFY